MNIELADGVHAPDPSDTLNALCRKGFAVWDTQQVNEHITCDHCLLIIALTSGYIPIPSAAGTVLHG